LQKRREEEKRGREERKRREEEKRGREERECFYIE
jgi:hypothetical protein